MQFSTFQHSNTIQRTSYAIQCKGAGLVVYLVLQERKLQLTKVKSNLQPSAL